MISDLDLSSIHYLRDTPLQLPVTSTILPIAGVMGPSSTIYANRLISRISLHDFESRIDEITQQLIQAAENDGFFCITDHGIAMSEIENMFSKSAEFFDLPDNIKASVPWSPKNVGWEKNAQIRPSTGTPDMKESYQIRWGSNMTDYWLSSEHLTDFKSTTIDFMHHIQSVSEKLMLCFARGLGFPDDFFIKAHDTTGPDSQTCFRLLHYFPVDRADPVPEGYFRAGAHADWGFLTLLFQRAGQSGLEICPGREAVTSFGMGDAWTKVEPTSGEIVCNIGDLLMSWSDDRFKSTLHRVKAPADVKNDYYGPRYSMGYFNQPSTNWPIQGPQKKYPVVTGGEFIQNAIARNYAALKAKKETFSEDSIPLKAKGITAWKLY
ncbi:hypothetical protein MMC13_004611 [Lambiella insularis]|nr:hypothetical protein [Lambiella insularis]